ncbi:MAG: chemotaxis protein CheA [Acidobacteriota bacterium]|nr:chemotaxis protein CheA [Acidobacteriota bacterium]
MDDLTQEFLAESQEGLDRMERCLTELEAHPEDRSLITEIFRAVHTIKGTTGFLGFKRLEKLAHAGENLLGSLRDGRLLVNERLIDGLLQLKDGLRNILEIIGITGGEGTRAVDNDDSLIASLDRLNAAESGQSDHPLEARQSSGEQGDENSRSSAVDAGANEKTLRIDVDVLNRMMNLVGDLVLTRNQILRSEAAQAFPELVRSLDATTADLRETVMQARMQPVGNLFRKFPRMVRDLAKSCGRAVRLQYSGQETGLDKSLLEAIKDPLTHAVRNAVDHGIEKPEARLLAGKPSEGLITLRAFQQSGSVVIEITDDGAGIATERVLAKAVERELVTPEQAAGMSERETLQLIFLPGFSTAAAVTNVSGRGVGMDVVRANIEKVGGSVELASQVGVGTTLRLRVPLTLAIVPALVVRCGGQSFALPQSALVELVHLSTGEAAAMVESIGSASFYRLRGRLLPMVELRSLLQLKTSAPPTGKGIHVAVLEAEGRRYGLVVEELMAPEEIVVKPLSGIVRELGLFTGAAVLGDGSMALIVDVAAAGQRAGVKPSEIKEEDAAEAPVTEEALEEYLLFEGEGEATQALPLCVVERIEELARSEISRIEGRVMLRYRGETLVLHDAGAVLQQNPAVAMLTVLICTEPGSASRQGLIVRRVLDVSSGRVAEAVDKDQGAQARAVLIGNRLIALCELRPQEGVRMHWSEVA